MTLFSFLKSTALFMCHIETLFIIGIIALLIYFFFFYKGNSEKAIENLNSIVEKILATPFKELPSKKIKKGKWKNEERCREIFNNIFGVEFKSVFPNWLKNPVTNRNLQLDGYNETIRTPLGKGLAFEYDGQQHAQYTPRYQGSPDEFIYQTKKDSWKDMKCKEKGVLLIRIPHFVAFPDLERYIKQKLNKLL